MATTTLTEDERLALAAVGGWQIADALAGWDDSLWDSHACGSIDDLVLLFRPGWRGHMHKVHAGTLYIGWSALVTDRKDAGKAAVLKVTRRKINAYADSLPAEMRQLLRERRRERTYPETTRLVWWALGLGHPPAEHRPFMSSYRITPARRCEVVWRNALGDPAGSPVTTATVAAVTTDRAPETVAAADRAAALRADQAAGAPLTGGQLWGLPVLDGDMWADIAGATAITGLPAKTINSYIVTGKPRRDPFPQPSRFLGRNYWPVSVLSAWAAQQAEN
ncbi:hypothetical protein AB0L62_33260 [Nocardia asteroides]|uniref:hypothetical protein n=1 Tax=Nocardia asteroides TaxID=1824 RepID=UPI00344A58C5